MEPLQVEFHCLLARLGNQLTRADVQELSHHFEVLRLDSSDESFHALFSLEATGHISCYSPDKLLDALSDIGQEDLAKDITEYKESIVYHKAMAEVKVESKPRLQAATREKAGSARRQVTSRLLSGAEIHERQGRKPTGTERGDPPNEKDPEAKPLTEAEGTTNPEKTRWWNMFSVTFAQTDS